MSAGQDPRKAAPEAAYARLSRWRWGKAVIWVIPLVAVVIAGYLVHDRVREYGPAITVRFGDGSGVRVGQTPLRYRGVQVGEVTSIELGENQRYVEIKIRLQRSATSIAREGSMFWIVRPEVGIGNVTGLATVITGPEIQVLPGTGGERKEFTGLDRAPAALELKGLKLVLRADRLGSLQRNSPVYYRGVEVGVVQEAALSRDATAAQIDVLIRERYARLVRMNSVFWNVSGVSMSGGVFRGVRVKLESLRSLAAGGINFATPGDGAPQAKEGAVFPLHAAGRNEWLSWAPRIPLPDEQQTEEGRTREPVPAIPGVMPQKKTETGRNKPGRPAGAHP